MKRICIVVLALASIVSAAVILWLNRGTTFFNDEITWFIDASNGVPILEPHNSHLHGTTRLLYTIVIDTIGPEYVIFRLLGVITVVLTAWLFYIWARRRIGAAWALLPALLLLFLGSASQHVVGPIGFTVLGSIAAGLGALLALERNDRKGDLAACVLTALSAFTFTVGLAYIVGVGVKVMLRRDRWRRAWIFAIPLALYAAWYLWARQFEQGRTTAGNIAYIPEFIADSLAVATGAATGINIPFNHWIGETSPISIAPAHPIAWVLVLGLAALVIWRIRSGDVPRSLYASIAIATTYWLAGALADLRVLGSQADQARYVYPGTVGVLLIAVDAVSGAAFARRRLVAGIVVAVLGFGIVANAIILREGGAYFRDYSQLARVHLAMVELAAGLEPGQTERDTPVVVPDSVATDTSFLNSGIGDITAKGPQRDEYLVAVQDVGSPAFTLDEVHESSAVTRQLADQALFELYTITLQAASAPTSTTGCTRSNDGESTPLPPGGALLKSTGEGEARLSRFGDAPGPPTGVLEPGEWARIEIPTDRAPERWSLSPPAGIATTICPIGRR